ncbi:MAG: ABC transporter ATP-binding protein [Promethearchaeota archaeon]
MTEFAIETIGLKKEFKSGSLGPIRRSPSVKALQGVDFKVSTGENYCLLGPNGSGKTTLIRCILGLFEYEGSINILGYNMPKDRGKVISEIGYMPQEISLYPDLSVKETMHFFGKIFGVRKKEDRNEAVKKLLDIFLLKRWQKTIVENLSGGMKRRLSLACSLIHNPKLIILDEPTVGVDPNLRISFWEYFKELNESGATIITTTHIMDEAEKSRVIGFMRSGKLIAEGTYQELKKQVSGDRKLILITQEEDTNQIANLINKEYNLKVLSQKFKLEVFYNDDSMVDNLLLFVRKYTKIRSIQTTEPNLEDTFIFFSRKSEEEIKK